ncbi:MAG: bifunctional [glutamate--ammonia ligase]-adenylyl-L-tyrosine phosphorylase/[glutamate--ammonia-ligase] adenylyltransferase [Nitrosomonadaceae bacterium]|nr:bifunctional [glutamate--ammonia ligase]-adenylyl-L-tyrosine phosphorylase/[glutamate--ammonia-ligase] adenylyltransferase [Nitrosomonadaceae bacterium]
MIDFDAGLRHLLHCSRFAERVLRRSPALEAWLQATAATSATSLVARFEAEPTRPEQGQAMDVTAFDRQLRKQRESLMLLIIYRDLNGLASLNEVMRAISAFADYAVNAARAVHHAALCAEWGIDATAPAAAAQSDFIVVGMGKLGAHELNVSSDIDLIFVYPHDGDATAARSWHEFHAALGKRIIRSIDQLDADGFVFRVDMRLRPFGASGPLVVSLAGLADYFIGQARPWERYAWLKARAICGQAAHVEALDALVQPFVYRRYHDFAAIDEMRSLHAQIREEAMRRGKQTDIKVGAGGIREVEFIAQLPQLIRGGREVALRTRSTVTALAELARSGLHTPAQHQQSLAAYMFLRNLEHRLQYLDDQQTQALPQDADPQQRIAAAMGFPDWAALIKALDAHRQVVSTMFDAAFGLDLSGTGMTDGNGQTRLSTGIPSQNAVETPVNAGVLVADASSPAAPDAAARLRADLYQQSARRQSLSGKLRARLDRLYERVLSMNTSATTAIRLFDVLDAIDKRETYLALLDEYPRALDRLSVIVTASAWAADLIRRHPILLETLTRPAATDRIDWALERQQIEAECDAVGNDVERQYDILRHARQRIMLRLFVDDIEGRSSLMALSDHLSALADMLLDITVQRAWHALVRASTNLSAVSMAAPKGFAVIGYGKLGSKELGYQSDLDLVFLYDAASPIGRESPELFARLTQRVNSWLNTMTPGGVLYETDLRLRPDGAAGLLVSSMDAFADYQSRRAWTWEHQALTRARWCAGDAALAAPFEAIRRDILSRKRDLVALREEIVTMRDRMRAEKKDRVGEDAALDLKNTVGGVVDVEFIVQYLILAYSHEHPEFIGNLGNFALINRAAALGILEEEQAAQLGKAYLAYRARLHQAQLNNERKAWIGVDELSAERRSVAQVWRALFGNNASRSASE